MHHAWPAKSPDLSCLDFWFRGAAKQEVSKSRPSTINELKLFVNMFAAELSEDAVTHQRNTLEEFSLACMKTVLNSSTLCKP